MDLGLGLTPVAQDAICCGCWGGKVDLTIGPGSTCPYCGGSGMMPDYQLSPNFLFHELVASEAAQRLGLPNVPTKEQAGRLLLVAQQVLQPMRDRWGPIHVNSALRQPAVNAAVGGAVTSAHLEGWAADCLPKAARKRDVMNWVVDQSGIKYDQAIYEYGTWVHVGLHSEIHGSRRENLMIFPHDTKTYNRTDPRVV